MMGVFEGGGQIKEYGIIDAGYFQLLQGPSYSERKAQSWISFANAVGNIPRTSTRILMTMINHFNQIIGL